MAAIRKITKKLNSNQEVSMLRKFFSEAKTIGRKLIDCGVRSVKGDNEAKMILASIEKYADCMETMLTRNFNNDIEFTVNPIGKMHFDADVYKFDGNNLVRTGHTRTIGGLVAEYCLTNSNISTYGNVPDIMHIDITDMIRNDKECIDIIQAFHFGYTKSNKGKKDTLDAITSKDRGNIGKIIAVAMIIDKMVERGFIPLSLKTQHWSPFYEGQYMFFASDGGDVPAGNVVLPFVYAKDWDRLNALNDNFFGSIENHLKFMFSNAEKHSKYLYSDIYNVGGETNALVIDPKDINDPELRDLFIEFDGHCFCHESNNALTVINHQIAGYYITTDGNVDMDGLQHHLLGLGSNACQIRGHVIESRSGASPVAAHMPKGVMSIWRKREFDNAVKVIVDSNPNLASMINNNTIIMTTDVGKKMPTGLYKIALRINSFECDKIADSANYGYLFATRTMPTQMAFEATRLYMSGKSLHETLAAINRDDHRNWVTKKAMTGYQKMIDVLTRKAGDVITPVEAYNNINELFTSIADKKVEDDLAADSDDARFLGFNEFMTVFKDIAMVMSIQGKKSDVKYFTDVYSNMLERVIKASFRVKLNKDTVGFVRRGYLIPVGMLRLASGMKLDMKEGTYALGVNLDDPHAKMCIAMRSPVIWQFGQAPFEKTTAPLKTADYDISYFGGIALQFGYFSRNAFQADYDGDSIYLFDFAGFSKHDKRDHISYKEMNAFYDMFWKKLIRIDGGHAQYVHKGGIEVDESLNFDLYGFMYSKIESTKPVTTLPLIGNCTRIAKRMRDGKRKTATSFPAAIKRMTRVATGIKLNERVLMLSSTMYRETLGQSIGLGDTKFSIATSMISVALANKIVEYCIYDEKDSLDELIELELISAHMAAYLQAMIEAIKHNDGPMISVDKATNYLIKRACHAIHISDLFYDNMIGVGDILSRIRKGRLNKYVPYTDKGVLFGERYTFKTVIIENVADIKPVLKHFNFLDRMVLETAAKLHKYPLCLDHVYETVIAADMTKLTGAIGGAFVQKLVGGNIFSTPMDALGKKSFNQILFGDEASIIDATKTGSVYNVPHRMSIGHAIVNYVGTVSRTVDDGYRIGTASVVNILRNRIIAVRDFIKSCQKQNNERFDKFMSDPIKVTKYDDAAFYFQKYGGNIKPNFDEMLDKMGIVRDHDFADKFAGVNNKVAAGQELDKSEELLWNELQLRLNDALPSNITTFLGVLGALINKPEFRNDVFMYVVNSGLFKVLEDAPNSKFFNPGTIKHRTSLFGIDSKFFLFELLSTIFVLAAVSGNKSLYMLLGARLTKFFIELYDVDFVGAKKEERNGHDGKYSVAVPVQTLEITYEDVVDIIDVGETERDGKTFHVYSVTINKSEYNAEVFAAAFDNVTVLNETEDKISLCIVTWYKHLSGFKKRLTELGLNVI